MKDQVEKEIVEKEIVQKLGGIELRSWYYVLPEQPNSNMNQHNHPGDVCAGGNSLYICDQIWSTCSAWFSKWMCVYRCNIKAPLLLERLRQWHGEA